MDSWPFAFAEESPWGRCFVSFLAAMEARSGSAGTRDRYERRLTAFFTAPPKLPDAYSREDVERFVHRPCNANYHRGLPPAPGTMNNRLSILSSFYKYAATYTIADAAGAIRPILTAPSPTLGMRAIARARPPYRALTAEELARFFAAIPTETYSGKRDRALFLFYFWTCRRRMEVLRLTWGDVEQRVIIDGNVRRMGWTYQWYGKGKAREADTAELPPPAAEALFGYLRDTGRLADMQPDHALFTIDPARPDYDPRKLLDTNTPYQALKRYAKRAGLDPARVGIHSLRHTGARERYSAGSDIREIQHLLRHRSLATTDTYLRLLATEADTGYQRIEQKFAGL